MKSDSAELDAITLEQMRELWPKSDEGRLCARLLLRYGFTLLVESAVGAQCTELRAQAESGASKAIAKMVQDFGTLSVPIKEREPRKPMAKLNRFQEPRTENQTEK